MITDGKTLETATLMTEDELDTKYPVGTPWWQKDTMEKFICNKHNERTLFIRITDTYIHIKDDTECK